MRHNRGTTAAQHLSPGGAWEGCAWGTAIKWGKLGFEIYKDYKAFNSILVPDPEEQEEVGQGHALRCRNLIQ